MKKLTLTRTAHLEAVRKAEGDADDGETVVRVSVSSETPYVRTMQDPDSGDFVDCYEVLGHKDGEIDDTRIREGLVIQDTHDGDQIGLIRSPELKDGKLGGTIEWCSGQRAQEIKADAAKGLRRNMSVGYIVEEYKRDGEAEDGLPIFRVTKWMPYEASFVNVPADTNVGVGRSAGENRKSAAAGSPSVAIINSKKEKQMKHTTDQVTEAYRLASAAHVSNAEARDLLESKEDFAEVREALMTKLEAYQKELAEKPAKSVKSAGAEVLDEAERKTVKREYSLMKVLRALAGGKEDIGFEREISDEIAKRTGKVAQGIYIPNCVRTITAGAPSAKGKTGANAIATDLMAGEFVDAIHDKLVLAAAGMRTISGLVGNVEIPKGGKVAGSWIATEGADANEQTPDFGQVAATPHTAGAYVDLTRKFLMQTSIGAEAFVQGELVAGLAALFESAAFNGTGTAGAPKGIFNTADVPTVSFTAGAPTLKNIVDMVAKMETANTATDAAKWIMPADVWALLRSTMDLQAVKSGDATTAIASGRYLADPLTKTIEGLGYLLSNLTKAKEVLLGDFSQLVMMLWGGTDVTVDPYALSKSGGLRIIALQDCDFVVRRPEAFVRGTTVIA